MGSDDLVAQARKDADYARSHGVPEDGKALDRLAAEIERLNVALASRDKEIERLAKELASVERELDEAGEEGARADDELGKLEARAEASEALAATAARERDEARAECERLKQDEEEMRVDIRRFKAKMKLLVDHCSMDAFDKLEEENGVIIGWSKTDYFMALTSKIRAALHPEGEEHGGA